MDLQLRTGQFMIVDGGYVHLDRSLAWQAAGLSVELRRVLHCSFQ